MPKIKNKSAAIDEILARLPAAQRIALERIRKLIPTIAPAAEECISYGLPAFRIAGRPLIAFGAAKKHCSVFPMSGTIVAKLAPALERFETSKGTIRFTPENPIPAMLLKKIVKARAAEIAALADKSMRSPPQERQRGHRKAQTSKRRISRDG